MRFRITQSAENGINLINLHDQQENVTVSIVPDHGAMLHAFVVSASSGPVNIISNYPNKAELDQQLAMSYKSSKLSPFPCRIEHGTYTWRNQEYQFANRFPDGSAIHGLLFNKAFEIVQETTNEFYASVLLQYAFQAEDPGYPFKYTCQIRYTLLHQNTLQVQTILTNTDTQTIPIADGWHPYFQLGDSINDCELQFTSSDMLEFNDALIPTGKRIPFQTFNTLQPFDDTVLDNCFVLDKAAGEPVCELRNTQVGLSIRFTTDGEYPFLQLYTPPDRKSLAIENLTSAPNCFNNKIGLLELEPGDTKTLTLHYTVQTINS